MLNKLYTTGVLSPWKIYRQPLQDMKNGKTFGQDSTRVEIWKLRDFTNIFRDSCLLKKMQFIDDQCAVHTKPKKGDLDILNSQKKKANLSLHLLQHTKAKPLQRAAICCWKELDRKRKMYKKQNGFCLIKSTSVVQDIRIYEPFYYSLTSQKPLTQSKEKNVIA